MTELTRRTEMRIPILAAADPMLAMRCAAHPLSYRHRQ
jgi:hypothetical protein